MTPIVFLLIGLVFGGAAAWALASARSGSRAAALQERLSNHEQQAAAAKGDLLQRDSRIAELDGLHNQARIELSKIEATLIEERKRTQESRALLEEAKKQLSDTFKSLSGEALKNTTEQFLSLAKTQFEKHQENAKGDLEKRQQAIFELVKPVKESLDKVDVKIQDLEKARAGAYGKLEEHIKLMRIDQNELKKEAGRLVNALRAPQARGRWGEIQLKRVVELAGMVDHCDFEEQSSVTTEDGRLRPDLIVRLPGSKNIVVDAKVSLSAYLEAAEETDEELRRLKMVEHARQVKKHVTDLGKKSYWDQFAPAPEFVVLFLPGENFFSAAMEQDPELIEYGVSEKVIIATPTTLISLLKAVSYGWRQENLAQNAKEISDAGRELYKRLSTMAGHLAKVGKHLDNSVDSYNAAVSSLESRVLVSARKLEALDVVDAGAELQPLSPIDKRSRGLQAPELLELSEGAPSLETLEPVDAVTPNGNGNGSS